MKNNWKFLGFGDPSQSNMWTTSGLHKTDLMESNSFDESNFLTLNSKKKTKIKFKGIHQETKNLSAIQIQRIFRGYRGRLDSKFEKIKENAAVQIQKIVRGMLVRLSDKCILAQVYMKLPTFWREVAKSVPPRAARQHVYHEDLKALKNETKELLSHILTDIFPDGVLPPKLPVIIPQPFDKAPYVSLSDGRRLPFSGESGTLLSMDIDNLGKKKGSKSMKKKLRAATTLIEDRTSNELDNIVAPIHSFNMKFWPPTAPTTVVDTSILEHNPHVNNFDVGEKKRDYHLCTFCQKRFELIHCDTCQVGYCFFCAFNQHNKAASRNHVLKMMEPRLSAENQYNAQVSKSLIYHIDAANQITHDIRYLVKYLRSATEMKRIQEEKRLRKEYEEAEEKKRMEFIRAQLEDKSKHNAASKIAGMFRSFKARKVVALRRLQHELEKATDAMDCEKKLWTRVQRRFRQYSTRKWFAARGVKFNLNRKRKKKRIGNLMTKKVVNAEGKVVTVSQIESPVKKEELEHRVEYEANIRRMLARQEQIDSLFIQLIDLSLAFECNLTHWLYEESQIGTHIQRQEKILVIQNALHFNESQVVFAKKPHVTEQEFEELEKPLRAMILKIHCTEEKIAIMKNMQWWIAQHVRCLYRRKSSLALRFEDTLERLKWVATESLCVSRIEYQMKLRYEKFSQRSDAEVLSMWISTYMNYASEHQARLDAHQQTLLSLEANNLSRDAIVLFEFDSLVSELVRSQHEDVVYSSERIAVEIIAMNAEAGSDLAVRSNERLIELKKKQKQLQSGVIDSIKIGLQEKMDSEDDKALKFYGFVHDRPDLPIGEMSQIEAILIYPYHPPKHCVLDDFFEVYLVQPFLAEEAVKDLRLEEMISKHEMELDMLNLKLKALKQKVADGVEAIKNRQNKIKECKDEMILYQDEIEGENQAERNEREAALSLLASEIFKHENGVIITQQHIAKLTEEEPPINKEMGNIAEMVVHTQQVLEKRRAERKKIGELFFKVEEEIANQRSESLPAEIGMIEKTLDEYNQEKVLCEMVMGLNEEDRTRDFIEGCLKYELADLKALRLPRGTSLFWLQQCKHLVTPRLNGDAKSFSTMYLKVQIIIHEMNAQYLEKKLALFQEEEKKMNSFHSRLPDYLEKVNTFHSMLLTERRQKILQQELEARKKKVIEAREYRLRLLKEAKEKAIEDAKKAEEEKNANVKPPLRVMKVISETVKKNIRSLKDKYEKMKFSADQVMDEEEQRMAAALNKKAEGTIGGAPKPTGIRRFYLTKGSIEQEKFTTQQKLLFSKGLPYFKLMDGGLGSDCQLWYQPIKDPRAFITDILFTHKEPTNPFHVSKLYPTRNLIREGFEKIEHYDMNLVIWTQQNALREFALSELRITMKTIDENNAIIDGFIKIEPGLKEFGLADIFLWWKKINKIIRSEAQNTNHLMNEIKKTKRLLQTTPNEPYLKDLLHKQTEQLEAAHRRETASEVTNPLASAVDLLALTPEELEAFMRVFERIDVERTTKVTLDDIFSYFGEPATAYGKDIFVGMDALDPDKLVEFGDFMRAISTFGFFGIDEILRSLYLFADKDKVNLITCDQFVALLNILNPFDKTRAKAALKLIKLSPGKPISFEEFKEIHKQFPAILHPAFRLQETIRQRTMGEDWWFKKLTKYKQVREKMSKAGNYTDQLAQIEMKRFEEDNSKEKRMQERKLKIQQAGGIGRILLEARQFVDEYS